MTASGGGGSISGVGGAVAAAACAGDDNSATALRHVRALLATGLKREFAPWWPLPLPTPLPQGRDKHTLVLDIDETLLHTYGMSAVPTPQTRQDHATAASVAGGAVTHGDVHVPLVNYHVLLRPHVQTFLREVSELFEVVFWTAGTASYCAAVLGALECDVLQLPPSFYHYREMLKEANAAARSSSSTQTVTLQSVAANRSHYRSSHGVTTRHAGDTGEQDACTDASSSGSSVLRANYYALSRSQTLQRLAYMKYLPMLGRPLNRVLMVDDNVRSFPLHPRHGVRVSAFDVDDEVMQRYLSAVAYVEQQQQKQSSSPQQQQQQQQQQPLIDDAQLLADLQRGGDELARLDRDTGLLDILPVLRAVATNVRADGNVAHELDYWRDDDYVKCDNFDDTMNRQSVVRQTLLGATLQQRRTQPIAPLQNAYVGNLRHIEYANGEMQAQLRQPLSKL